MAAAVCMEACSDGAMVIPESRGVRVSCLDGAEAIVDARYVDELSVLKNVIEDVGDVEASDAAVPLAVESGVMAKALEFLGVFRGEHADDTARRAAVKAFFDAAGSPVVIALIAAANYLGCEALLDRGCQHVADDIRGLSIEQMREKYHIVNDMTPEEEKAIVDENQWAFT